MYFLGEKMQRARNCREGESINTGIQTVNVLQRQDLLKLELILEHLGPVRKQINRVLETPTQLFAAQHLTGRPRQEGDGEGGKEKSQ